MVCVETRAYGRITIGGGDTDLPLNMAKRLRIIRDHASGSGLRILDCGCGAGSYVTELVEHGCDAYGVEFSSEKVAAFRAHSLTPDRVVEGDIANPPFDDGSFDTVIMNEVLEHVPNQAAALAAIRRLLRHDGRFILFAPNRLYPFETHGVTTPSGRFLSPLTPLVPYVPLGLGRRLWRYRARNYWPWELHRMLTSEGFVVTHRQFIWQTFEGISRHQPRWMTRMSKRLQRLAITCERVRPLSILGVSQVLVCEVRRDRVGP